MKVDYGKVGRWLTVVAVTILLLVPGGGVSGSEMPTLDELLDIEAPGERDSGASSIELDPAVQKKLTGEQAADAFQQAVDEMDTVSLRLGRAYDPGLETQRMQEQIIARLDQVIESAREQSQSQSGGGGSGGSADAQPRDEDAGSEQLADQNQSEAVSAEGSQTSRSTGENRGGPSSGQVGSVSPRDGSFEELRKEWGNLPPRLRNELTEGMREPFSPIYRTLTEAYYRRLAEINSE